MTSIKNLILENINFLKTRNINYKIKIDNDIFENLNNKNAKKIFEVHYGSDILIEFYDNIDNLKDTFLISFDKLLREYTGIPSKDSEEIIFEILKYVKTEIDLKDTIEELKRIFENIFQLKKTEIYLFKDNNNVDELKRALNIKYIEEFKEDGIIINNNIMNIPFKVDGKNFLLFELIKSREKSYDIIDYIVVKNINEYISKTIETSYLETRFEKILDKSLKVLTRILEARVPGAEKHCESVYKAAIKIGEKLNLTTKELKDLKFGSMIFDIGKIGIPEKILLKKEELTNSEKEEIRKHVIYGYELVSKIPTIPDGVKEIVLYHHEKWNGEGYPYGLKGDEIPILAQIIGLLDAYYSMLEDRPYRTKIPKSKAIELIEDYSGVFFNSQLVELLKEVESYE
ncbi:HD-GYP domain-containing protein [Marinitoga piezophila KA3]|uniref:HD-GYP domain-containing protein n=1 Tax=Marinitoga piezophila (strain DSM 14283 / JCM 11233 / KA3) TaxID=443254 RepID=H2J2T0_MARPK|nr:MULTISPECIES: HD domain-containing phosphohydrolase [Marinitoga]AEX84524.1 HD-GYP domain-containing protein [Marinitoga piezophila KA3]